jgi:hypothetical protein
MTSKNKPLKGRILVVNLIAPSRVVETLILNFSVEISETLKTLGPKSQNDRNYNLRLLGGALKEVVLTYSLFGPNVQVPSDKTS